MIGTKYEPKRASVTADELKQILFEGRFRKSQLGRDESPSYEFIFEGMKASINPKTGFLIQVTKNGEWKEHKG